LTKELLTKRRLTPWRETFLLGLLRLRELS